MKQSTHAGFTALIFGLALAALVVVGGYNWHVRAQENRFVVTVGGDDTGGNDCTSPDQPCATIQYAISQSGPGDLIVLGPGTYFENVTVGVNVTVQGDGTDGSTVNGNNTNSVFVINNGVDTTLNALTITNGNAGNSSSNSGGGIQNNGTLTVIASTIQSNQATTGTNPSQGGGIRNGGTLTVINSTISGNTSANGGGIYNFGTATVVNSTIQGNSAGTGGGILNTAMSTLNLTNTIIAGSLGGGGDCVNSGTIATNSHNLIQDGSCSPSVSGNPKLGPLQNNGGPTPTHALLLTSPAINAGDDSVIGDPFDLTTDQRGQPFAREVCTHVDIGAFEFGNLLPIISCPGNKSVATDPGLCSASVSFSVTATDQCGSPITPVCVVGDTVITSPHTFPLGTTPVTCTATDSADNMSTCPFTVTVSQTLTSCLQDDSNPGTVFQFNPGTGAYIFVCGGTAFSGTAQVTRRGNLLTFQDFSGGKRVQASIDIGQFRGTASIQSPPGVTKCTLTDRDTRNNNCVCQF